MWTISQQRSSLSKEKKKTEEKEKKERERYGFKRSNRIGGWELLRFSSLSFCQGLTKSILSKSALQVELRGLPGCGLTSEPPTLRGQMHSERKGKVEGWTFQPYQRFPCYAVMGVFTTGVWVLKCSTSLRERLLSVLAAPAHVPPLCPAPLPPTGHLCTAWPRLPGLWLLLDLATSQFRGIGGVERQRGARLSCLPAACSQGYGSSGPPCLPAAFPAPGTPALWVLGDVAASRGG